MRYSVRTENGSHVSARIRGNILMALSNKFGYLVLATGNKSECKTYKDKAQKLIDKVSDPEDKKICQGELDKVQCG